MHCNLATTRFRSDANSTSSIKAPAGKHPAWGPRTGEYVVVLVLVLILVVVLVLVHAGQVLVVRLAGQVLLVLIAVYHLRGDLPPVQHGALPATIVQRRAGGGEHRHFD